MGAKRQPKPPPAPDPRQIAQTDAEFNRIDQITPFGSLTFGGPNRNVATLALTPEIEQLFNTQISNDQQLQSLAGQALPGIGSLVNKPLTTEGLPSLDAPQLQGLNLEGLPAMPGSFAQQRDESERAFFERGRGLLEEQFGRDEEKLRQTLANQGLQSGGRGFDSEFGTFNQRRGETFENLARDAVIFGGSEASRSLSDALSLRGAGFDERLTGAGFNNQVSQAQLGNSAAIRGQLLGEQQALRGGQFNELASLLGLQQTAIPGLQNFFAPSQAGVTDAFALNEASQQNSFNQRSASARAAKGEFSDLLQTVIQSGSGGGKGGKGG